MGNHEYCVNCGESDFHYGRSCDPIKVAARLEIKEKAEAKTKAAIVKMKKVLDKLGINYQIDEYGNAKINNSEFTPEQISWRKERNTVKKACGKIWWSEVGWDDHIELTCVREKGHKDNCKSHEGIDLNKFYKEKFYEVPH